MLFRITPIAKVRENWLPEAAIFESLPKFSFIIAEVEMQLNNLQIWLPLATNFLALWVWELFGMTRIRDD